MQERHNSIANALELHLSCINPWMYHMTKFTEITQKLCCNPGISTDIVSEGILKLRSTDSLLIETRQRMWKGCMQLFYGVCHINPLYTHCCERPTLMIYLQLLRFILKDDKLLIRNYWDLFSRMTRTIPFPIVSIMAADYLVMQGVRASVTRALK